MRGKAAIHRNKVEDHKTDRERNDSVIQHQAESGEESVYPLCHFVRSQLEETARKAGVLQ